MTLTILIFLIPLTWLRVNEVRGEGVSYSSLTYVLKGNALLRALKNGNYEKAFYYLDLKALYDWETESEGMDMDKEINEIIQSFLDMGYDGYVDAYKKYWINNFEQKRRRNYNCRI